MSRKLRAKSSLHVLLPLCVAVLTLLLAGRARGKNLVVFFNSKQNDFIQIFVPNKNGAISESRSQRYAYDVGVNRSIAFSIPTAIPKLVRMDPLDGPGELVVHRIEITELFATRTLQGAELLSRLTADQSVETIALSGQSVIIRGSGLDPITWLDLSGVDTGNTALAVTLATLLLALMVFCLTSPHLRQGFRRKASGIIVPLLFTVFVVYLFFPGYMTYDSFHALRSARNGVVDSAWPPIVSYIWRGVDAMVPHPTAMLFGQVFLLFWSTSSIVFHYTQSVRRVVLTLGLALLVPVLIGTIAAIWKDVLMASFFTASFALMLPLNTERIKWRVYAYSFASLLLLVLGTASRHNAIVATLPLAFYLAWLTTGALNVRHRTGISAAACAAVIFAAMGIKVQLDRYSLPSGKPISGVEGFIGVVRTLDLFAASICANEDLLHAGVTVEEMRVGFDSRHSNSSLGLLEKVPRGTNITQLWIQAFKKHPICFFSNKVQLAKHLLGAHAGEQFLVVSPQVDANEFGYYLPQHPLRTYAEAYIVSASKLFFLKPWFLWLLATTSVGLMVRQKKINGGYLVLWTSASFYAVGLFLFGNAADARLLFYSNYLYFLVFLLLFASHRSTD